MKSISLNKENLITTARKGINKYPFKPPHRIRFNLIATSVHIDHPYSPLNKSVCNSSLHANDQL